MSRSMGRARAFVGGRAADGLSRAARTRPAGWLVALLDRLDRWPADRLAVLTYHRVDEPDGRPDLDPALVSATPSEFRSQMGLIAERFRPIAAEELVAVRAGRDRLPPRAVLVTFDDGYIDFRTHAWPILREHRVPATLFVTTAGRDEPSTRFWWDRLHAALASTTLPALPAGPIGRHSLATGPDRTMVGARLRAHLKGLPHDAAMAALELLLAELGSPELGSREPPTERALLGWSDLAALRAEGVAIAPHTRTHPLLTGVSAPRLEDEIEGSLHDVEARLGSVTPLFAYPAGAHDVRVATAVERAGLRAAFTTVRASNNLRRCDWYRLRRINVGRRTGRSLLCAQLLSAAARLQERTARSQTGSA